VTASGFDPLPMVVAGLFLAGGVVAACYVPGRRATRIAPTVALRE